MTAGHIGTADDKRPRIGLALGGGGARGIAHVAILEVLDELGIRPDAVVGTSIGALIGSAYASGLPANRIREHLVATLGDRSHLMRQLFTSRTKPLQRLLNVVPLRSALLDPVALLDLVLPAGLPANIENCEIPFKAVATDMAEQGAAVFGSGNLRERVAASIAIPVVFAPVTIDGRLYADGGLVNPLPLDVLKGEVDILIGIDVTGEREPLPERPSVTKMLVHSVAIFQKTIIRQQLLASQPDIYMDLGVGQFGALEFNKVRDILSAAEPAKAQFRERLTRVLGAPTLQVLT